MMGDYFQASAWNNGLHRESGSGYGIKFLLAEQENFFDKKYENVILYLGKDRKKITININKNSFWNYRVLNHIEIGKWLIKNKKNTWPKKSPPKLLLKYMIRNEFQVTFN